MPIFTVIAPNWAKAMATVAAAKNGKNIEAPFGLVGDKEKRPGSLGSRTLSEGDVSTYAAVAAVTGMVAGGQRDPKG